MDRGIAVADGDGNDGKGGAGGGGGHMFTQAQLEQQIAERLGRERAKYADYDELKARAAAGDKTKSDVDKLTDAVKALTDRAEKAERETIRRDVADRHKLPKSFARKLSGTTKEDLEREAAELVAELKELGVKFDGDAGKGEAGKDGKGTGGDAGKDAGAGNGAGGDGDKGAGKNDDLVAQLRGEGKSAGSDGASGAGGRPKETLRSGVSGGGGGEGLDHNKMADEILGNRMF